jgi:hypothetical protein
MIRIRETDEKIRRQRVSKALAAFERTVPADIGQIAGFVCRVDMAAVMLSRAYRGSDLDVASGQHSRPSARVEAQSHSWTWEGDIVDTCLRRLEEVLTCLRTRAEQAPDVPPRDAERAAWYLLADLTPIGADLDELLDRDVHRGIWALIEGLDLTVQRFEQVARVIKEVTEPSERDPLAPAKERFEALRDELLERSGGAVSLAEAARVLGVTKQALHKRIKKGTALGLMSEGALLVPRVQFEPAPEREGQWRVVDGLGGVVSLFDETKAGRWAALQFLVDVDPNLAEPPIEALKAGKHAEVAHAARVCLNLGDEPSDYAGI